MKSNVYPEITDSMLLQHIFTQEHSVLSQILATIPYHVWWKDTEHRFLGCNQVFADSAGLTSPAELIGKTDYEMPWQDGADGYRADDIAVLESGKARLYIEEKRTRADGSVAYLETSKVRLEDRDGTILGTLGLFRDVTEKRDMELQISQKNKLESMGQLAAGIAHEINTPAQFVGDNTEFLEDSFKEILEALARIKDVVAKTDRAGAKNTAIEDISNLLEELDYEFLVDEVPTAIEQSLSGVDRIKNIVQSMKVFSHPGTDERTPVNINEALQNTVMVASNEWRYCAEIDWDLDPELPMVNCLPGEMNQVFLNIVVNAAHAIEDAPKEDSAKGTINIRTCRKNDGVEIRIRDTGCGIPQHLQNRIFDQFFTTKEVGRGTGQGLTIAYSVVTRQHNGSLDFESEPGEGTTFIIRLPLD